MKKLILILLFISSVSNAQALYDITSPNAANVIAVGTNGLILKSTNGGNNYTSIISGLSNLQSVHALGMYVWAAGDNGTYISSTNLGISWQTQTIGGGQKLNSVYFADSLTGYIAGNNGLLLKTINRGTDWNSIVTGVNYDLNNVKFTDVNTGYISGENTALLKTTNGGINWSVMPTPSVSSLRCFEVSGNEIIAGSSENILYRSTNLGVSWESIKLNIQSLPGINALAVTAPSRYFIILESGSIWNTTNGGSSFTYAQNEFLDELHAVTVQGQRCYSVSRKHMVIIRSQNLGTSWSLTQNTSYNVSYFLLFPGNDNFNKILDFNYQKRGVLYLLDNRYLRRSLNFGSNWELLSTIPDTSSFSPKSTQLIVNPKDSSKMLAGVYNSIQGTGYQTKIYRTSDYGLTWIKVLTLDVDLIGNYMNRDMQHPDTVYLGAKDTVFRSTDFGSTWTKICEAPFQDWCDIAVNPANSQILYAATNHYPAKLHKSTNSGVNWIYVDFVLDTSYSEMPCIAVNNFSPNVLLHAQFSNISNQSGLKRSYSSGNTWLFNQFPGASWSVDIAKDDPGLYMYGSVSYDPIFLSTNSGISFLGLPVTYAEQLLFYDRSNLFINNHSSIYKMQITYHMPVIGIQSISGEIPLSYSLRQNYPNPFNPTTNIEFSIPEKNDINIVIYDAAGREVAILFKGVLTPGKYKTEWNAANYPSGIYFCRLSGIGFSHTRKMVFVK